MGGRPHGSIAPVFAMLSVAAALAASAWGFTADQGTRLPEGVSTETFSVGGTIYAWTSTLHGMVAYTSTDGLTFTPVSGFAEVIGNAVSADLRHWTPETGVRVELGSSPATGVPDAVVLPDGPVRLYDVVPCCNGGDIDSSISSDGLTFTKESGARLGNGYGSS